MPGDHEFTENEFGEVVNSFVTDFPWEDLDTVDDELREYVRAGGSIHEWVEAFTQGRAMQLSIEAVAVVLGLVADAPKPRLTCDHIAWFVGMRMMQGELLPSIAKRHGVSPDTFRTEALALAEELGLKPSRLVRRELGATVDARQNLPTTTPGKESF